MSGHIGKSRFNKQQEKEEEKAMQVFIHSNDRSKLQAMKQKQKDLPRLRDTRTAYTIPTFPDEASRHTHTPKRKEKGDFPFCRPGRPVFGP